MQLSHRPRRLRQSPTMRDMIRETQFSPKQLCMPLFICEGKNIQKSHPQVPGIITASVDQAVKLCADLVRDGIPMVLLFGVVEKKDAKGSGALDKNGPVVRAIQGIRSAFPNLLIGTDIALDPYTDHGHDGLFQNGEILNDATVEALAEMSCLHAKSGAQILAPSDMMDGRVVGIRSALDQAGFQNHSILSYTAKYASCLYGPFRDTLDVSLIGDKKTYQMDPANRREASRELELDLAEGADMVMVKPASWYLDIISDFKSQSSVPVSAYQVSGECALIELGAKQGLFDRDRAILESAQSIYRAGCDLLVTYFAQDLARIVSR